MNAGIFGEGFPYSNFHDLNMDWIIKIAKDFLDQYTHIQEIIEQGKEDIETLTESGIEQIGDLTATSLQDLQDKKDALEALLQDWYDTHSADIANQLADALADLNDWYTTHQNFLDQYVAQTLVSFRADAEEIVQDTLESLPDDYTKLAYNNLNDNAKLLSIQTGKATTQNLNGFEVVDTEGYMEFDGSITYSPSQKVLKLSDTTIKHIILPQFPQSIPTTFATIILKNNNTVVEYVIDTGETAYDYELPNVLFTDIYINWWGANTTPFFSTVDISYSETAYKKYIDSGINVYSAPWGDLAGQTKTFLLPDMLGVQPGYLDTNMQTPNGTTHQHIILPSRYIRKIVLDGTDSPLIPNVYWYKTPTAVGSSIIAGTARSYEFPCPTEGYIGINIFRNATNSFPRNATITFWTKQDIENVAPYFHSTRKPFNFHNKTAIYAGTSITVGHTTGTTVTENYRYPKLFSEKVGFSSYSIIAQAGACFVSGLNAVTDIVAQVQSIQTAPDFLFIEGGTNDYTLGAPISTFKNTINSLCDYLTTYMPNTEVIFITSIPMARTLEDQYEAGYTDGYIRQTAYNKAIAECVHYKDVGKFSVVEGYLFGFPDYNGDATYINQMFGDKVHPSEKGYRTLYFNGLCQALL